jgi:hypothetical protein
MSVVLSFRKTIAILRMKQLFILLIVFGFSCVHSKACSCLPIGNSFCQTINADTSVVSVVMVKKLASYHYGMQVKHLATLSGQTPADTILVWGDNGILCRKPTGNYSVGDTLILALQRCDMAGNTLINPQYPAGLELATDYQLSVCGVYCLTVNQGIVQGAITAPALQLLALNQFLTQNCLLLGISTAEVTNGITVAPNPVTDQLFIQFTEAQQGVFRMYNTAGQLVFTAQFNADRFSADLSRFQAGLYFAEVQTNAFREVRQISVVR